MERHTAHELIIKANELLKNGGFEYALCGGFAIELFLNRTIRKHGDIDVSAYWHDRDKIILYMQSLGWNVYEMCGGGIDVWRGSFSEPVCDVVICTIDLLKKDSEIKMLIGCTEEEKAVIMRFHSDSEYMKGVMIRRESEAKI